MAIPITIPRLGWNMEEGTFGGWLKGDGDRVRSGEALFRLESEKATEEIESMDEGILRIPPNGPKEGETLAVGKVIGYLTAENEAIPATGPCGGRSSDSRSAARTVDAPPPVRRSAREGAPVISPRARRVARELGIEWTTLRGSGRSGRIRECDVRAAVTESPSGSGESLRRIIAERMAASHLTTAPVTLISMVDSTSLVRLRNDLRVAGSPVPSYTDIVIQLAARALQAHPALNSRWENERVSILPEVHIGIAVDTPAGLLVPVVRNVPALRLDEIAMRTRDLIQSAREKRLPASEMRGGTFTVSNLGGFGIDAFTPIINQPECAVLGMGRIQKQPVVIDDQIVIRECMTLSLTFDHRIVDGAPAARFLQTLRELIEKGAAKGEPG